MTSKTVLNKIMAMLSFDDAVELTYAKLKDGTIVESPTFDVGEPLDVVSEDGTKTPAPDGEHELSLKDESGNENLIKVIVKDGKIAERENVELETVKVEEIPQASGDILKENEQADLPNQVKSGTLKMAEQTEEVEGLPEDTNAPTKEEPTESEDGEKEVEINLESLAKQCMELSYRIQEMETKLAEMMPPVDSEVTDEVAGIKMSADEEEELPKLDGAPVEEARFSAVEMNKKNYGKRVVDSQSSFLAKLYK